MRRTIFAWVVLCAAAHVAIAETHTTGVPALESRPGAAYTIYLDFAGFSYTGTWLGNTTPGVTPAFDNAVGNFTTQQQANIANVWARVAEKYAPFDINVTTVDPAAAAGQAGTDAARQAYYDSVAHLMHTVVGGTGAWYSSNGSTGVSAVRTTQNSYWPGANGGAGSGMHTNWVFSGLAPTNLLVIGEVASHENGHGLGLSHQVDVSGTTLVNAYSSNFGATGYGSYAPVMGSTYYAQRGTWRSGTADKTSYAIQNDVRTIMANQGIGGFVDDGIGHTVAAATPLALSAGAVDPGVSKGIIVPASSASPTPIGVGNYVTDYFSFRTDGSGAVTLTAVDGGSRLTPGVADPGATLRSTLRIFDGSMNVVGTATLSGSTLSETFTGTLPAGRYFAEVASAGGYTSARDATAQYFDMGSYFLTGTGFSAARWMAGAVGGDWATGGNWLGGVGPLAGEDVVIPAGAVGVTHSAGSDIVRGVTNAGGLSVTGGAIRAERFENQAGGTLSVAGGVTIGGGGAGGGTFVNAGTVVKNGSGDAVVEPTVWNSGTVAVHGGGLVLSGGLAAGLGEKGVATSGAVVVDAGASLTADYLRQETVTAGGLVTIRPAGEGGGTSAIGTLVLTGTGTLDVADNSLVMASEGVDALRQYLRSAYDLGSWDGPGVTSSVARSDASGHTGIGYVTAGGLGVTTWGGIAGLAGVDLITRVTLFGDANLNGAIDPDDFALTDRGLRQGLTGWVHGDFDYSGSVDMTDYWLLDRSYLMQVNAPADAAAALLVGREAEFGERYVSALIASLPEPGGVGVGIVVALGCGGRRRRGRGGGNGKREDMKT